MRYELVYDGTRNKYLVTQKEWSESEWHVRSIHDHKEDAQLIIEALEAREQD